MQRSMKKEMKKKKRDRVALFKASNATGSTEEDTGKTVIELAMGIAVGSDIGFDGTGEPAGLTITGVEVRDGVTRSAVRLSVVYEAVGLKVKPSH